MKERGSQGNTTQGGVLAKLLGDLFPGTGASGGTSGGGQGGGSGGTWGDGQKPYISGQDGYGQYPVDPAKYASNNNNNSGGGSGSGGGGGGGGSVANIPTALAGLAEFKMGSQDQRLLDRLYQAMGVPKLDLSNPFGFDTDRQAIQRDMGKGIMDAGMLERAMGLRDLADSERMNYQSNNALRASLAGSMANIGQSGGSLGAKMGALTSAILGQSQAQAQGGLAAQQNLQNINAKVAAGQSQAVVDAYSMANANRNSQGQIALGQYNADQTARAQALLGGANLAGVLNTNLTNVGINNALNKNNTNIANATNKSNYYTYKG